MTAVAATAQEIPETLPESPLPGGVAAVVRFFFHVPQWIQIGGAVLAAALALVLAVLLWRRRRAILAWIASRPTALKAGMAAGVLAVVIVGAGFGKASWDYMQHDNDFCTGCHVMSSAFQRFTQSEHAELQCHDCHRQSIFASARQLYLWVLERPEAIGEHAPVPNRICAECHIRERPDSVWQRIAGTAGHRVHLESDTSALGDVLCVTCHGQEVHRFVPADQTCGQADCHAAVTTDIVLGAMAGQTGFHCVVCHQFATPVSEAAPVDTAAAALVPRQSQCFSCHDMERLMGGFDAAADPHDAVCGACHDPHVQETPAAAFTTCTEGGCHAAPDTLTPFHRGIATPVLEDCGRCHGAHTWTVEGENCAACHPSVVEAGAADLGSPARSGGWILAAHAATPMYAATPTYAGGRIDDAPPIDGDDPTEGASVQEGPFRHRDHRDFACAECHSSRETHGRVTVTAPGGCFSCHHERAAMPGTPCASCHAGSALAGERSVSTELRLSVWDETRVRSLPFDHEAHAEASCADCHAGSRLQVTASCADCHAEHHDPEAACATCHIEKPPATAHGLEVHLATSCGGAGCHAEETGADRVAYGGLPKTRSFCLSCHQDRADHELGEPCAGCHRVPERTPASGEG